MRALPVCNTILPSKKSQVTSSLPSSMKSILSFLVLGAVSLVAMSNLGMFMVVERARATQSMEVAPAMARNKDQLSGGTLVYDVGFNNGDDTRLLLSLGYQVVAVEANPVLVKAGEKRFAQEIQDGRLVIAPVALPMDGADNTSDPEFYISHLNDEWSSFVFSVGCRSDCWNDNKICAKDRVANHRDYKGKHCCASLEKCDIMKLPTLSCSDLYDRFGMPYMLKLDVEGAETGCMKALQDYPSRPRIVSVEVGPQSSRLLKHMLRLGYEEVKIVQQSSTHDEGDALGVTSGPLGDLAQDCTEEYGWRSLAAVAESMAKKPASLTAGSFLCNNNEHGWYDWHFRHPDLNPPGLGGGSLPPFSVAKSS